MLADVDAGTDTPSFVGKVLKWREANRTVADELWRNLGKANDTLGELLRELSTEEKSEGYQNALVEASKERINQVRHPHPCTLPLVPVTGWKHFWLTSDSLTLATTHPSS